MRVHRKFYQCWNSGFSFFSRNPRSGQPGRCVLLLPTFYPSLIPFKKFYGPELHSPLRLIRPPRHSSGSEFYTVEFIIEGKRYEGIEIFFLLTFFEIFKDNEVNYSVFGKLYGFSIVTVR